MAEGASRRLDFVANEKLKTNLTGLFGAGGVRWLEALPELVHVVEQQWNIQVAEPFDSLSYHFVATAIAPDQTEAVLKLGVPTLDLAREASCLECYQGRGAARLLMHDPSLGALLLERVRPGENLKGLEEAAAIEALLEVMEQLHQAHLPELELPTIKDWGQGFARLRGTFNGSTGPLPAELVSEAERLFFTLAGSMDDPVVLHGDLHHGNILSSHRDDWLAIDPQGVLGEASYELGAYMRNPMPALIELPNLEALMTRRLTLFSELSSLDPSRIAGWGFSQAVLSAIWSIEDHGDGWQGAIRVAQALQPLLTI
jgi:streptomycin 6-kinase